MSNKTTKSLLIISCAFSMISAYEPIAKYYSSTAPSDKHTIEFDKYKFNFSQEDINKFKEQLYKDFLKKIKKIIIN